MHEHRGTQTDRENTDTFSLFLSVHSFSFSPENRCYKRNPKTDGLMHIQSAAGFTRGTKVSIASHLPARGQTRDAELDWEPAVGGSSQLHNTCLRNQNDCLRSVGAVSTN